MTKTIKIAELHMNRDANGVDHYINTTPKDNRGAGCHVYCTQGRVFNFHTGALVYDFLWKKQSRPCNVAIDYHTIEYLAKVFGYAGQS